MKTVYLPEAAMLPRVKLTRTFASSEKMRQGESTPPRRVVGYETGIYLTDGGELTINYTDERVTMTGSAEKVFEGSVEF